MIALVLAIRTRKVKIKGLNDSKEIMAIIYMVSIVDVELILVTILLGDYNNIRIIFFSGGIIFGTTMTLALVFVPKVTRIYSSIFNNAFNIQCDKRSMD